MPSRSASEESGEWALYARAVGAAVRRRRRELGLTQLEVASRAGIARSFYQYVESGAIAGGEPANPSLRVMVALAQALEIEVSGLLPIGLRIDPTQR